ncbi:hypothetical protein [Thermomonospora umbrina]|nr:hypothetical protein [Thermomonospora umbrina]
MQRPRGQNRDGAAKPGDHARSDQQAARPDRSDQAERAAEQMKDQGKEALGKTRDKAQQARDKARSKMK